MIVMVYRTYEAGTPALLSLSPNFTDEQFVAFVQGLADVINAAQVSNYDRTPVTLNVLAKQEDHHVSLLDVDVLGLRHS